MRPFTHHNNNPEEVLGTWLVEGNTAIIEYFQPANVNGQAKLVVGSVVHGYRTAGMYQKSLNESGPCNHDVDCDITPGNDPFGLNAVKENIKSASGMLVSGADGFCSGTLINNTNNDGRPFFMTANHCGDGQATWAFRFNWRSTNPSCGTFSNSGNGPFNQTVSGSVLRASSSDSDMALVEITDLSFFENNDNLVWVGWNKSKIETPTVSFGVHHPSGDIQKVCREDDEAYRNTRNFNGNPNTQMWEIDQWELGVTEPGSSGSGLFNQSGELIGVLSGGSAACSGTSNNGGFDYYGRFGVAWDFARINSQRLDYWLDPVGNNPDTIEQFPPLETVNNDARTFVNSNIDVLCDETFQPDVFLVNSGNQNLISARIEYQIDNEAPTVVNWTGNLASLSEELIASPSYPGLSEGAHSFTIRVFDPNGVSDENSSNDTFVSRFNIAPEVLTEEVTLNLITDNFGFETTWEIRDSQDNLIDQGPSIPPYGNNATIEETITISNIDECYTFTLFDSFGDGICCGFGTGSYNLQDENGNILIEGGDFGRFESVTFNVVEALSIEDFKLENFSLYPNPTEDILNIDAKGKIQDFNFSIFNTLGQKVISGSSSIGFSAVTMSSLQNGLYFVSIEANGQSLTQKLIKN
ncbi:MAG: T9SS type A sorting domain-containing protein [Bacteroidota bacterium]